MAKRALAVWAVLVFCSAPSARAESVVVSCEVWGSGGPDGVHLVGYAQGIGASWGAALAEADRDMRARYVLGARLGHCMRAF